MQDVKFPLNFDAFELCSPELKKKLQPARDMFEADEELKAEAELAGKQEGSTKTKGLTKEEAKEWERYDFSDGEVTSAPKL